jgi:hypothetical protein
MFSRDEFAQKLAGMAVGKIAIHDFEEWLVSRGWNVHEWADPALQDAVYTLELEFGEISNGHSDRTRLRVVCADLATQLETGSSPVSPSRLGRQVSSVDIASHAIPAGLVGVAA